MIAVLLPVTAFSMRKRYARARAMVEAGVPVAVATDCNPGSSFVESMPFAFGLSVLQMGLSVAEALTAATLNGAYAVGLGSETGSLTAGQGGRFSPPGRRDARHPRVSERVFRRLSRCSSGRSACGHERSIAGRFRWGTHELVGPLSR